jgi:hypothetical protein
MILRKVGFRSDMHRGDTQSSHPTCDSDGVVAKAALLYPVRCPQILRPEGILESCRQIIVHTLPNNETAQSFPMSKTARPESR